MTLNSHIDLGQHWPKYWLVAWRHYQGWLLISEVLRYSAKYNFEASAQFINACDEFEKYTFRIIPQGPLS